MRALGQGVTSYGPRACVRRECAYLMYLGRTEQPTMLRIWQGESPCAANCL